MTKQKVAIQTPVATQNSKVKSSFCKTCPIALVCDTAHYNLPFTFTHTPFLQRCVCLLKKANVALWALTTVQTDDVHLSPGEMAQYVLLDFLPDIARAYKWAIKQGETERTDDITAALNNRVINAMQKVGLQGHFRDFLDSICLSDAEHDLLLKQFTKPQWRQATLFDNEGLITPKRYKIH